MIISTKKGTPKEELEKIVDKFEHQGLDVTLITGKDYNVFGLVGDTTKIDERDVLANPWIDNVTRVSAPYKRANRLFHPADSVIDCGGVKIGGKEKIAVMAGPCSIEGAEQALRIAQGVKAGGATLFRGGAYKPRTSPYSFQGLETEGILDMVKAREATGMPIVSELMSEDRIPEFEEYVALELIKRGHRLVTDDAVEIRKVSDETLVGSAPGVTKYFIELRGIGIIDVKTLFGVESVKETQEIDMVIKLEDWNKDREYDRLGLEEEYIEYLGNKVVCHTLPVRPGRNLAVIVESAAVNHRQKMMGYNAAKELYRRVQENLMRGGEDDDE